MGNHIAISASLAILMLLLNDCSTVNVSHPKQTQAKKEMEKFITCDFFEFNKSGEAIEQVKILKQQGLVEQIGSNSWLLFRVVGEVDLFGLQPAYIGHAHGWNIGTFARFDTDLEAVVRSMKKRGTMLDKRITTSDKVYYSGEKKGYWHIFVMPISRELLQQECSLPQSTVDSTLVQCVYQGP